MPLAGRVALVTGASRGIGESIALALARAGADVALCARDRAALEQVANAVRGLGRKAHVVECDVADPAACAAAVGDAAHTMGRLDIVINNAGLVVHGALDDLGASDLDRALAVNLRGPFCITQAAVPHLRRGGGGTVVMIGSTAGKRGAVGLGAYCASKFGLAGLTECLMRELRGDGIRVVMVSPSSVDTTGDGMRTGGKGASLHRQDVADAVVAACQLPRRALVREIELWTTTP